MCLPTFCCPVRWCEVRWQVMRHQVHIATADALRGKSSVAPTLSLLLFEHANVES